MRHALCGNDVNFFALYERFRLFRSENYVFIVGENENIFRVDFNYSVGDILRGRIHRLPAFDNSVYVYIFENSGYAFARTDGKHSEFFLLCFVFFDKFPVFLEHILDFDLIYFAELKGFGQRLTGIVRVDVNFDEFEIAYNENAVAYRHKILFEFVDICERGFLF